MAITVETGLGNPNADSFATVAELQAFATARGFTLPAETASLEALLVSAADYLMQFESRYKGFRTYQGQRLPFPRAGIVIYGFDAVDQDEIPQRLKEAQMRLAISANSTELRPDGTGQETVREKVGSLEVEYSSRGSGTVRPQFDQAMDLLEPFLEGGSMLKVSRA